MEDRILVERHLEDISLKARDLDRDITIMEICGGHTNVIMRYGIRELLPRNIRLISGPGCPVCVSSQHDVDCVIELAEHGIPIATYGDMLRVPGSCRSLDQVRARGGKIFEVYSASEVLPLMEKHKDLVFFGIGFETTAPMTGFLLEKGVCVYSVHKRVPPAMHALLEADVGIDGFINPGHVSAVIGVSAYRNIKASQVIAGFTPERVLRAISVLVGLIRDGKRLVVNAYPEVVRENGNPNAQEKLGQHFLTVDSEWRGLGMIVDSGLEVRNKELNAKTVYEDLLARVPFQKETGCRCGEILRGMIEPTQCPLYKTECVPESPHGACMVSAEGTCSISYAYGK
jgi:hydrogenase expression/formation protein HypD